MIIYINPTSKKYFGYKLMPIMIESPPDILEDIKVTEIEKQKQEQYMKESGERLAKPKQINYPTDPKNRKF